MTAGEGALVRAEGNDDMNATTDRPGISRRGLLGLLAVPPALFLAGRDVFAQEVPVVAGAASLRFVLEEIAADFERTSGQSVRLTFGATGTLVAQIQNGAPYAVLLAADDVSTAKLEQSGLTKDAPRVFSRGALALAVPKGSAVALDEELTGLGDAVRGGQVKRFAIANPEIAPYGAAAKTALTKADLWDALEGKIIIGENVGQAAQFVASGAVEAGLIALSLTRAPALSHRLRSVAVDGGMYPPIEHAMAVMKSAGPTGESFAKYCLSPAAQAVFKRHGFLPPE